ncbi:ABC transporter permease [Propioniciclava coleopterorum]|uniref:Transport permease protein n=1 Tax=Propioniciclava coleopterorum TaxID=2714937 RepID=A0A6G7Y6C2_9ACTN|nr:ABC transporter permease [Propioniciclava coleopterorum]QIK72444.1 ABC transporter permease [Propioniciclava coleopterorum]
MTEHPTTHAGPQITFSGLDHAALADRTRRWGWVQYAGYRDAAERPFLGTTLAVALGNPVLYLAAMGLGLGSIVQQPVDGVPYLTFVAPGLLVSTVVSTGAQFGTWPIFGGFKWQMNYLAAQATPLEPKQMAQGEALAIGVRLLVQALLFWMIGFAFGAWPSPGSVAMVPIAMLAALAMFTPLMAYAATLQEEGLQFNFVQRLIVMPMFLFAGTFFPLGAMPIYLQWIGWVSPMWHGTQLARMVAFGLDVPPWLAVVHVVFLVGLFLGGLWAAGRTFTRRLVR